MKENDNSGINESGVYGVMKIARKKRKLKQ
jgi:hypothetical protein